MPGLRACLGVRGKRCPALSRETRCPACTKEMQGAADAQRANAQARGYTSEWSRLARAFRRARPLCGQVLDYSFNTERSECAAAGLLTPATVVDHMRGHRRGETRDEFLDQSGWMSSCSRCNNRNRGRHEAGGWAKRRVNDRANKG